MNHIRVLLFIGTLIMLSTAPASERSHITWRELPPLPIGLGGQFVGVIDELLVVAGGSYWPASQWEGGKKTWADTIYILAEGDKAWKVAGRLPEPLGYGAAVSIAGRMLCLGGQTPDGVSAKVFGLRRHGERIEVERYQDLPGPAMMTGGALLADSVYVAGGQGTPVPTKALHTFWTLPIADLGKDAAEWKALAPWPGPATFFPQMASVANAIYLTGGSDLAGEPPARRFLKDAYEYTKSGGWRKIADLPHPAQAGLAIADRAGRLLIFGGNDGSLVARELELKDRHPGFSLAVLAYDAPRSRWEDFGKIPVSLVTTGMVQWRDELVIAGGEDRPGHRSARVIAGRID